MGPAIRASGFRMKLIDIAALQFGGMARIG
jgi:hypothetical protein